MSQSLSCQGIVLKRQNFGEADRIVTLYTLERGKQVILAKGVRKLTSSRKSCLEPGTEAKYFLIFGRGMPLLTQALLIQTPAKKLTDLTRITQEFQILEIVDCLTVEGEPNSKVYDLLKETLLVLAAPGSKRSFLREQVRLILKALGFTYDKPFTEVKLKEYVEELAQRSLRSKPFLSVKVG